MNTEHCQLLRTFLSYVSSIRVAYFVDINFMG